MACTNAPFIHVELQRSGTRVEDVQKNQGVRERFDVLTAVGIEPEIFLYERQPRDPFGLRPADVYVKVCAPTDMEVYPVGQPDLTAPNPWFRLSYVDGLFDSPAWAETFVAQIPLEVDRLVRGLKALACLEIQEIIVIGDDYSS